MSKTQGGAPAASDTTAPPPGGPLDVFLQQGQAWLRSLEEVYRLQVNAAHMTLTRLQEIQQRLDRSPGTAMLSLPVELLQFQAAATLHFAQQLADIGVRSAGDAGSQLADAVLRAAPAWPRLDPLLPLSLWHTGMHPMDDLFGAAVNRYLMPNTAA